MHDIKPYRGPRTALDPLFAEADDSESQIAAYRDLGEVLVARHDGEIIGQLLIVETDEPDTLELKSLAVYEQWRSRGVGAALVQAGINH
jgi:N-acetylglutamate synthase-like GNAT family acetyltransferase